ncbi:Zn-dependent M28 family amino/carboxypeptidase [Saccharothrix saharensis]|uniref:Zn-dependent M28 family amino/carboxypeptidase n=1 Tax=Saccharothrix saharensis TaxID=571190 RepID=A0A543JN07_9PSEU|nr:M28 family peptidase [Saccharothrix saharensis]TQM84203.1 Zn-dependent M28 family amino/carboxypeptidase [Saccharothrix saharensis]
MRRRSLLTGAAAVAGAVALGLNPAARAQRPGASDVPDLSLGDYPVVGRVRARRAMEHLRVLSERIGQRIGGTESEHRARDYLASVLRDLRYQVTLQPFAVPDKYLSTLTVGPDTWNAGASRFGALGVTASGPVVDLDTGASLPADLTGKVALLVNVPTGSTAVLDAARLGAAAVLVGRVSTPPAGKTGAFSPTLTANVAVPVLGIAQVHVERLRAAGAVTVTASTTHLAGLTSYNVLAERPATFPGRDNGVVMVTAHYDSVPGSPGANDDGSGTVLTLELARVLRHLPTHRALRFALWGSEEQGLLGSRHYVTQLPDAEAARIAGVFQNDMVATSHGPATAYWLLSVDGGNNATTAEVAAAAARLGYGAQVHGPVPRGSSDHVPFHERKIAAANFSWRGEGGPHELEPLYHTPEDTIAQNVSPDRLQISLELIGAAAYRLARTRG